MTLHPFSVQLSYASVERGDGADPRPGATRLLRELRVLSAVRDATAEWTEEDEAVLQIALSDDGRALTLGAEGTITPGLCVAELNERFEAEGMTLWLDDLTADEDLDDDNGVGDSPDEDLDDGDDDGPDEDLADGTDESDIDEPLDPAEVFNASDDDVDLEELFEPAPVRVREFSRRGPLSARLLAPTVGVEVAYAEVGDWSLFSYGTTESTSLRQPSKAEGPVIVLNLPADGEPWVEVATHGINSHPALFWPEAERDTQPVLSPDAITEPASVEIFRALFVDGDGVRDELEELAQRCDLDVEAAHAALRPESLGGVVGSDARIPALLAAFGVPKALVRAAMSETGTNGLNEVLRFAPKSWARTAGDALVAGMSEATPLTRRSQPLPSAMRAVDQSPVLGATLAMAELASGVVLTSVLRGRWKSLGVALVADASVDLAVVWARTRHEERRP